MNFLRSIFSTKEKPIHSNNDFWEWFERNEKKFYNVLKRQGDINRLFFDQLAPKLNELKDGFWFLAGMYDDNTAELVLTADGVVKNIVFIEELAASSPKMENWKITALKQPADITRFAIEMDGYKFDKNKMAFYSTDHKQMPDEIDITVAHKDFSEKNRAVITNGIYLFLENALGELNFITAIDNLNITNPKDATGELIPITKLKDFLTWREKEFIEKYKGYRHDTENDRYSGLEATMENGLPLVAIVNSDLLKWDGKASHPWIAVVEIKYNGKDSDGMPDKPTYGLLNEIEEKIMKELKDSDGYLNVGRETVDAVRRVYFACIEFRKPSKTLHGIKKEYENKITVDFDIYKDKYWQSFNRFMPH